jgi:hypothetical protein
MAVPKPNYTQTPNRFIDEYMCKVSPNATCIYLTICRKTIGYHKDTDEISISQIVNLSGLSKNSVLRGIAELEALLLISVTRKGKGRRSTNTYGLNFEGLQTSENAMENGAQNEPLNNNDEKNGAQNEPINPVIGAQNEPINPVIGAQNEHTKEINIKKEYKETNIEPVGSSAHSEIDKIFQAGSKALTGQIYYKDGKEARQIKLLEPRYNENPEAFKKLAQKYYYMISKLDDDFWNTQPFTPSAFNSHYNRILCFQLPATVRKQEEQKLRTEWDELMDHYGKYDDAALKYFLRCKQLSQKEYDYIIEHRMEVSA